MSMKKLNKYRTKYKYILDDNPEDDSGIFYSSWDSIADIEYIARDLADDIWDGDYGNFPRIADIYHNDKLLGRCKITVHMTPKINVEEVE